jgi:hypothetical protein
VALGQCHAGGEKGRKGNGDHFVHGESP